MDNYTKSCSDLILKSQVKAGGRRQKTLKLFHTVDLKWVFRIGFRIRLKSPPVNGKANQELIALLAKKFKVPKAQITIKAGLSARDKLIEIG